MVIIKLIIVVVIMVPFTSCVELDLIDCGIDHDLEVTVGDIEITTYPWVGIFYYTYRGEIDETRAVTTVILIQSEFVIANAADIGPIPKHDFRKKSRVLLGEHWRAAGRRVRNYVLHPEYGETYNTLALIQLRDPVRDANIKPACPAPETLRNPVFYVMKFLDDYNELKKQVIPVAHVPSGLCRDFYMKANLYSKMMRPPHVACAVALDDDNPCVWDSGAALVSRDVWGRWMLKNIDSCRIAGKTADSASIMLGVGARGPGCGAPARFLDMASYASWVKISLDRFQRITISKINSHKYVLRTVGGSAAPPGYPSAYQRFGACDMEEKVNCIYRDTIRLQTDNSQYQFMTYNMTIQESVEYTCLTLELINASGTSEMSVRHYCPRENYKAPCYFYKGTVFMISVFIMFSDACLFEMYAWGHRKSMTLLDIQEWKWEEGTYYEDFSTLRHEYRGQTYMTEYGYEPLDEKMWIPDYNIWSTTPFFNGTTTTEEEPEKYEIKADMSTEPFIFVPSTTSTPRTKRTFRRRTSTTEIYFLWGVPRENRSDITGSADDGDPHFFYRKNTTVFW